ERLWWSAWVGLRRSARGCLPWRRHQHARAERARGCAVSNQTAACELAAVPEFLAPRFCIVGHRLFLPGRAPIARGAPRELAVSAGVAPAPCLPPSREVLIFCWILHD